MDKTYDYLRERNPDAPDSAIYAHIASRGPWEYKLQAIGEYIYYYNSFTSTLLHVGWLEKQIFVNSTINDGFDPETAEIYGNMVEDYSQGMVFEFGFTIAGSGIKAASALKNGESLSEGKFIAGSGAGNLKGINGGSTTKPNQVHHYATNKNKTYTQQFKDITDKYGLNLDSDWNKELLPHQGRHPNAYHEFILDEVRNIDNIANGNADVFLDLYESEVKSIIRDNPEMMYKNYWDNLK